MLDWCVRRTMCRDQELLSRCEELYDNLPEIFDDEGHARKRLKTQEMYDYFHKSMKDLTIWYYGVPLTIVYLVTADPVPTDDDILYIDQAVEYLNGKARVLSDDEAIEFSLDEIRIMFETKEKLTGNEERDSEVIKKALEELSRGRK